MLLPTLPDGLRLDLPYLSRTERRDIVFGRAERSEIRLVRKHVPPNQDIVDLGASVGVVGSRAVRRLQPGQKYVGVEMVPSAARLAQGNIERHAPPDVSVTIVNAAICSTYERVGIYEPGSLFGSGAMPGDDVPTTTLSRVLTEHSIREGYTLLMDIEGSESDVFTNDRDALLQCGRMIAELHDSTPTHVNPWGCSIYHSLQSIRALGLLILDYSPPVYACFRQVTGSAMAW